MKTGSRRIVVAATPPRTPNVGQITGHWRSIALSPDRLHLLAQWSGECEVPIAIFIQISSGRMWPVTGEEDWALAPTSLAWGWTTSGRALVVLPELACGDRHQRPGLYAITPAGEFEWLSEVPEGGMSDE